MKNLFTVFLAFLAVMLVSATASGASRFSVASTAWASTATWSATSGGASGASVPIAGDDVFIEGGFTVTLGAAAAATNVTVSNASTLDAGAFALTVSGTFTLASGATFKQGGAITTTPGSIISLDNASTFVFNGSQNSITGNFTFGNLVWSSSTNGAPSGNLTINGNLTLLNSGELRGTTSGTKTHSVAGNVVIDGASAALVGPSGLSAGTSTWNINGSITTQNGGFLTGSNAPASSDAIFNVKGNVVNNGDIVIGTGSGNITLTLNGSSSQSVSGNAFIAQHLTIDNSAGVSLTTADVSLNGVLTLTSGALNNSTHLTLNNGSTISRSSGTLAAAPTIISTVDVTYTGSGPTTTGNEISTGSGLGLLTLNCSGGIVLNASATVNGNLVFSSGKLSLGTHDLTFAGTTISGATSSNYIVTNSTGYFIQNVGALDVTFPIGTSSTYNPAILNNTGGTADNYSVRVASSTAGTVTPNGVVSDQWTINEVAPGGSNIVMTLQWNAGEEGGSFTPRTSGQIGKYSGAGTSWSLLATTVSGGGPYIASNNSAITGTFANSVYGVGLSGSLPVELTSFTAAARNGKVALAWGTATEVNNYGFEVERKTINNEQSTMNNWEKIGFIEGYGTTNVPQNYSFTDAAARVGKYSYRLKQIDRDGQFELHQAVEVTLGITPNTVWLDNNYPNPFNPSTKISFVLGTTGNASLKVFDLLGKEVVTLAEGNFIAGEVQSFTFDASKYSSGIYYYRLISGTQTEMKKMLLLK